MKTENKNKFTIIHRFLHWIIALFMFVLFITGFLRMYWMNRKTITNIIETATQNQGVLLEKTQLSFIVKSIQAPMWEWHIWAAYIVLFAFLARLIYTLVKGLKFPNPFIKKQPAKNKVQGFIYLLIYLLIATTIITGFYLKWGDGQWKQPMEWVHKWAIYWFPIFVLIHFGGILVGELTNKKGITSKMIGGDN